MQGGRSPQYRAAAPQLRRRRRASRSAPQQCRRSRPVPRPRRQICSGGLSIGLLDVQSNLRRGGARGCSGAGAGGRGRREVWTKQAVVVAPPRGRYAPQLRWRCRRSGGGGVGVAAGGPLATVTAQPLHSCVSAAAPVGLLCSCVGAAALYRRPRRAASGGKSAAVD